MIPPVRFVPLLLVLFAATSAGCGVFGGASPTPTPTATPTHTATPTVTPTSTATLTPTPAPALETEGLQVAQGGTLVLRTRGDAASATATFDGRAYPLLPRQGGFWGVIGVDAQHATGAQPISVVLLDGAGAVQTELTATVTVVSTGYPVETIELAPEQSALLNPELAAQEAATRVSVYAGFTPERLWSGPFLFPSSGIITSPYGTGRSYNGGAVTSFHSGTDFALDEGSPVVAANAGRVAFTGELPIRGTSVMIDHGAGVFTAYHHLQSAAVQPGQPVAAGDLVGFLGGSGLATGPHLHWEVIVGGVPVDAVLWTFEEYGP